MTDSHVAVPPDSSGKRIDTAQIQVDNQLVQRQRVVLGDNESNNFASINSNGAVNVAIGNNSSTLNNSTTPLTAGATFTGTAELSGSPDVIVSCITDQAGTLYFDFSVDGTNWNTFPTNGFAVAAGTHEFHRAVKGGRYFRARLTNTSASPQTYLRLYTYFGLYSQPSAPLNQSMSSDNDAIVTRSVLTGETDGGKYVNVPVTPEGHLEVALHHPRLPFGSIHTENLTPVFQADAVYQVNGGQNFATTLLGGTVTATDSSFTLTNGTNSGAYSVLESRKRLRYRPGQGIVSRFTALYSSPVANSYQIAGLGHPEDGIYFGYGNTGDLTDTRFGILYVQRGVRATYTLTLTTRATSASNVTIKLNGSDTVVALTNSTLQQNVYEIAKATYSGWDAYPQGATVVFVRNSSGATAGAFSYAAGTTGSAATIAQTKAGVASTDTFIPQSTWNGDVMDGTGNSGFTLDPTKYNVFQIGIQYLGAGCITFQIEATSSGNNPEWVTVHTLKLPNTLTKTSFGNPSLPFTAAVYSAGSTSSLTMKVGSYAGFIEGHKHLHGNRYSYNGAVTANTTLFNTELTILNPRYFSGRSNQSVVNLLSISFAQQHTSVSTVFLMKNATLVGAPNFAAYSSTSCTLVDTAATSCTITDNAQMVWSGQVTGAGQTTFTFSDEITLQPGEYLSIAAKASSATPSVQITVNTREDQ